MKLKQGLPAIILVASLLGVSSACAQTAAHLEDDMQPLTLQLDPHKTNIQWTLDDVLHEVHGTFQLKQGVVTYDPRTGAAGGLIVVSAGSGESGNGARDRKMQKDELQSDRYPEITFRPQHVSGSFNPGRDSTLAVTGIFSLHGAAHPLTMNVSLRQSSSTLLMDAAFDVPYIAWGIKDPSTFVLRVGKTVRIKLQTMAGLPLDMTKP